MTIQLSSSVFQEGQPIPVQYTCDGGDYSPPLHWQNIPEDARTLALICDDPDAPAGTWVHWVLYDLPATATILPKGVPDTETTPGGGKQGKNSWGRLGYGGPCPPRGNPHRYFFRLYALDSELALEPGMTKAEVLAAMEGHILAKGQLMGTYQRR